MKQVTITALCDLCANEEDDDVPGVVEVTWKNRLLDVCERHEEFVRVRIEELERIFSLGVEAEAGSRPERASRTRPDGRPTGRPRNPLVQSLGWRTCPDCGHVTPTRSGLGQHTRAQHGKGLNQYTWPT